MEKLQDNLPQWHKEELDAVIEMSGDDDGLQSACLLSFITGYPITDFTDFNSGRHSILPLDKRERISVDLPKPKGKGIDNHFMQFSARTKLNKEMINVNNQRNIPFDEYLRKYGMSTFILIYAIYKDKISLPKKERLLMMILTIDSGYKGYYDKYRKNFIENLEYIGLKDELLPILEKHTKEDFEEFSKRIREQMPQNFYLNKEGHLVFSDDEEVQARAEQYLERLSEELGFPIALPRGQFHLVRDLEYKGKHSVHKIGDLSYRDRVYCYAIVDRGNVKSSSMVSSDMYGKYIP
ncbi:hypothetical protein [Lysinibacillus fusiformis]|uniref:hypothetical protein n=1 Tax=Lysinibacillus fusiformis TaxID=28031 RepID=UPI001377457C|nr:hypothetical protein [Lysinibacillus fusiformis]